MRRLRPLPIAAAAALLVLSLLASGVAAATLGGVVSASLRSFDLAASTGAPIVYAWENFDGPNNTVIGGTTTDGGAMTWSTPGCTWRVQSNQASVATSNTCAALLPAGATHRAVEATVTRGGSTWDAGLVLQSNATGTQFLTAEWTSNAGGSLELWKYNSGAWTQLAGVTNLYPGGVGTAPASIVLRFELTTAHVLQGSINGLIVTSATLSAGDQSHFENAAHQFDGLMAFFDTASRWNDFHLQSTT